MNHDLRIPANKLLEFLATNCLVLKRLGVKLVELSHNFEVASRYLELAQDLNIEALPLEWPQIANYLYSLASNLLLLILFLSGFQKLRLVGVFWFLDTRAK
jgi:hypothetical protein